MIDRFQTALADLYRDLRDRRLLVPALALLLAMLAVPVLLSSDPPDLPAPAPSVDHGAASATEAAVLAEQTGVRDYRKRLAGLGERNPFESRFAPPEGSGDGGGGSFAGEAASAPPAADPGIAAPPSLSDPGIAGTAPVAEPEPPRSTAAADSGAPDPTATGSEPAEDGAVAGSPTAMLDATVPFYAATVDVSIGPIGKGRIYGGVENLEFLPDEKTPLVALVGVTPSGDEAVFSVARGVIDTHGEGSCAPKKPAPCEFVTLEVGEDRYLNYEPNGKTYRLKLLDTTLPH